MKILLSNDDGILASGLQMLYNLLQELGHEIRIVAPDRQYSGTSHTITLGTPLIPQKCYNKGKFWGIAINGSPADSVKIGLANIYPDTDLVVTGINLGHNAGPSTYYSGTIGAAFEGSALKKTAIAFSYNSYQETALENLEDRLRPYMKSILENCTDPILYNINIPCTKEIKGIEITRQYQGFFADQFIKRKDPRNRTYYWLKEVSYTPEEIPELGKNYRDDLTVLQDGYISLTPLQFDLTDYTKLVNLQNKFQ
ncbi:MAG: 5'/3'-nucleotidase SurE [Planctomycetes bacterium]|jgi:5'-nucleotidase|nr:5'/3'-nucleotidase SurE [Planctomycetota bacterium]HON44078.1 5'/3'-nucleotidase SurE [Planctomycetota bacterium]HPY75739.1 5'/3'-nucleotidase SurE [Planctomycetota bacterium]HQB01327.1 5'/3'-nucleotidase SurE [Planctomycetota bacterium]HRU52278.1 5'/3'-nucleotidase SurE [Planctomycetota bacterium]